MAQTLSEVSNNTVQIVEDKCELFGTGFFIQKGYCVTCHHVICTMDKIKVKHNDNIFDVEWYEKYSNMQKDIAVLKLQNPPDNLKPLETAKETTPEITVKIFGVLVI